MNIALTRALAIEGRVLDPWDAPMSEVMVMPMRADGTPYPNGGAFSDDRGDYRVFGLPPGRYRVCGTSQGSTGETSDTYRFLLTCHPAAIAAGEAADIVLTTSDVSGIDIRMQRGGTFKVSGSVTDAAGAVVDSPHVAAFPIDRRAESGYTTGRDGRFTLGGLMPARYILRAWVGGADNPDDTRPPLREREVGYISIDVVAADVDSVITLSKAQTVSGRVIFEGGPVPPPSQLRMAVQAGTTGLGWALATMDRPPTAPVTDKLTFKLAGLYRLPTLFTMTGLPDGWAVKSIRHDGNDITNEPVTLGGGSRPGPIEIVVTNRVAQPSVRVTDERGDALSAFHVVLLSADRARRKSPPAWATGAKSQDGVIKLNAMLPGDYYVAALGLEDFGLLMNDLTRLEDYMSIAARVTFAERDDRTLDLRLTRLPAARR